MNLTLAVGSYQVFKDFVNRHNLNENNFRLIQRLTGIRGFYNRDLLVLDGAEVLPGWPAISSYCLSHDITLTKEIQI